MTEMETHLSRNAPTSQAPSASRPLRVLQIKNALTVGGGETWMMALLRFFDRSNREGTTSIRNDILLTQGERHVFDDEAESRGAGLHYIRYSQRHFVSFARRFRR